MKNRREFGDLEQLISGLKSQSVQSLPCHVIEEDLRDGLWDQRNANLHSRK